MTRNYTSSFRKKDGHKYPAPYSVEVLIPHDMKYQIAIPPIFLWADLWSYTRPQP